MHRPWSPRALTRESFCSGELGQPAAAEHMARLAVGSLKEAGKRGIIVGGWAELSEESLGGDDAADLKEYSRSNVLFLKSAPHEWLFPQCACCVHHGGIGTTQASLSAGVPTLVTPVFADQKDIAAKLSQDGHGEGTVHLSKLSAKELGASWRQLQWKAMEFSQPPSGHIIWLCQ
eukprot:Skav228217  [mRNA]  locus=scaffold43:123931:138309:+ [translate_table: standard]